MPEPAAPPSPPSSKDKSSEDKIADATPDNWVDRYAPASWRPYLRLARLDRPIGTWLLFWPCLWGLALALPFEAGLGVGGFVWYTVLFTIGATVMRGAGCTYNDIVDADIDAKVERTRNRPLPSGAVTKRQAWIFLATQCLTGFLVLIQFNVTTILVGILSLALIAIYPFMKRITYWPQAWLGLTFNWGILLGWTAVHGSLAWPPLVLYLGAVCWTMGYDTIYAHQDTEDDALIGVKSTALRFGDKTKLWLYGFYFGFWMLLIIAGIGAGLTAPFYLASVVAAMHLNWQITNLDTQDTQNCLKIFRSNRDLGAIVFVCLLLGSTFQ